MEHESFVASAAHGVEIAAGAFTRRLVLGAAVSGRWPRQRPLEAGR